eukprot:TRINITY_DN17889_c1_g1_i1.p1 TRINITY_DN17889_c1_g1~~TRINITY_DN17889_c1_g1_i1.p1  ORF type:complete len:329 (+),score=34.04 TRINITY_DN17889_c1_g1_i1:211-1197(+)
MKQKAESEVDADTKKRKMSDCHTREVADLAIGPRESFIAIPSNENFVTFWTGTGKHIDKLLFKKEVVTAAFSGSEGYYFAYEDGSASFSVHPELSKLFKKVDGAKWISFGENDSYVFQPYTGSLRWYNVPQTLDAKLRKWDVEWVSLGQKESYVVKFQNGTFEWSNIPTALDKILRSRRRSGTKIESIDRVWLSAYDDRYYVEYCTEYKRGSGAWQGFGKYFDSMMLCDDMMIPDDISYTQESVSSTFADNRSIYDTARDLNNGSLDITDLPFIRVYKHAGGWFSLDNRRLWCFRNSGVDVAPVKVVSAPPDASTTSRRDAVYVRYKS